MYYRLHWNYDQEEELGLDFAVIREKPDLGISWMSGMPITITIREPIECILDADESGPDMPDFFGHGFPLFSEKLYDSIRRVGCDNFQVYDVVLKHPLADSIYTNYKALNIIGLIECVDRSQSKLIPGYEMMGIMEFDKVIIDKNKAKGLDFFRLAENHSYIIVSERLKQSIENAVPLGIALEPVT